MSQEAIQSTESLDERLRERIRREGPISFYEWMKASLYDKSDGYYCREERIPQGRAGDYRTAPETSPLFAITFARYFSKLFAELQQPPSWTIFEAGAGGGEFARGVLSNLRLQQPEIFAATRYVIDEFSPAARRRVADRLSEFADRVNFRRLHEVNETPAAGIVFSNELIDAFPVHRVIMSAGKLRELCVGLNQNNFTWVECDLDPRVAEYCQRVGMRLAEGQIVEVNLEADEFLRCAAKVLNRGYVITVDYGAERDELWTAPQRRAGTLRAFHRHQLSDDILARPGEDDLTTTIDWTQLMEAGKIAGLQTMRLQRLDLFLRDEGLLDELSTRMRFEFDQAKALRLSTNARELILPHGLAASFQVLVQEKRV